VNNIEAARKRWIAERSQYDAFGKMLEERIRQSLKPLGLWFEVSSRAKTVDSLVKKLLTKQGKHTFDTLPDKVGARVVLRYRSDVGRVVQQVQQLFDSDEPEDKLAKEGVNWVGYLSIHIDHVRLRQEDSGVATYPPDVFWAELQVSTLAQHLWSDMSHDTVYKNDQMLNKLPADWQRRIALMAGQIEVADREFDSLNMELSKIPTVRLLQILERHYYSVTAERFNLELSVEVMESLMPLVTEDVSTFAYKLNDFLSEKREVIEQVYAKALALGIENENITSFLFQPEVLLIYKFLDADRDETRQLWNQNYPDRELERIANTFGISFD
jgi:ppGpp synthetase/RelA/SpoT-type nucleotidyltranferase